MGAQLLRQVKPAGEEEDESYSNNAVSRSLETTEATQQTKALRHRRGQNKQSAGQKEPVERFRSGGGSRGHWDQRGERCGVPVGTSSFEAASVATEPVWVFISFPRNGRERTSRVAS